MEERFRQLILYVFETVYCNNRKVSDGQACIDLIVFCQKVDPTKPKGYYGDAQHGFIDAIDAKRDVAIWQFQVKIFLSKSVEKIKGI